VTRVTFVRHGTTEWIERGLLHGVSDSPLSERGRREALLAARALAGQHFDAFYTSPLGRAVETARILSPSVKLAPEPLEGLREMNFGRLEGTRLFNFADDPRWVRALHAAGVSFVVGLSGESRHAFGKRVASAAREMARRHPDQRVLAVIHMAVRSNILARLVDGDPRAWVRYDGWPACAFTEVEIPAEGRARIVHLVVNQHLEPVRSSP